MNKLNIALALITAILGVYIAVALLLSRLPGKRTGLAGKRTRLRNKHKGTGPWTSFSS